MFRFGQASQAIGISEGALRNWIARDQLDLWEDREGAGWRSFTEEQIYHLALVAVLVRFGAKVTEAHKAVTQARQRYFRGFHSSEMPSVLYARECENGSWEILPTDIVADGEGIGVHGWDAETGTLDFRAGEPVSDHAVYMAPRIQFFPHYEVREARRRLRGTETA